jgi:hypothetical protein
MVDALVLANVLASGSALLPRATHRGQSGLSATAIREDVSAVLKKHGLWLLGLVAVGVGELDGGSRLFEDM